MVLTSKSSMLLPDINNVPKNPVVLTSIAILLFFFMADARATISKYVITDHSLMQIIRSKGD